MWAIEPFCWLFQIIAQTRYICTKMNDFKFDFSNIFWERVHRAPPQTPLPFFSRVSAYGLGFALNSRALRALQSGFALNFRLGVLVPPKWILGSASGRCVHARFGCACRTGSTMHLTRAGLVSRWILFETYTLNGHNEHNDTPVNIAIEFMFSIVGYIGVQLFRRIAGPSNTAWFQGRVLSRTFAITDVYYHERLLSWTCHHRHYVVTDVCYVITDVYVITYICYHRLCHHGSLLSRTFVFTDVCYNGRMLSRTFVNYHKRICYRKRLL